MKTRGQTSSAALSVLRDPVETVTRPEAPYDLTDEQASEWIAVVNTMPADWFMRGNYALLGQYCRHVIAARRIAQLIEQVAATGDKTLDRKEFVELLRQQEAESRAIMMLLRQMRLTQQAVYRGETAKHPKRVKKPWARED